MLRAVVEWINEVTAPLYTVIYGNAIFFIDYWSFVHFTSGAVVFSALTALRFKRRWLILFLLLLLYELIEITTIFVALDLFRPETLKDQVTDILVGGLGAAAAHLAPGPLRSLAGMLRPLRVRSGKVPFLPPPCSRRCEGRRFFS